MAKQTNASAKEAPQFQKPQESQEPEGETVVIQEEAAVEAEEIEVEVEEIEIEVDEEDKEG